jgi:RNA polymerase sigma factor (sigma-70 family)
MRTITNYTTYDLDPYYRDLHRIPRLSEQGKAQLSAAAQVDSNARNRLIEGHLSLTKAIVLEECPPHLYYLLPEMLAEANLGLVEVARRYETQTIESCTAYFLSYARAYAARARSSDLLIRLPSSARARAREEGTLDQLYRLQPLSMDKEMEWFQTSELEEPPVSAIAPLRPAPERNPVLRAQVEEYLSYLSPREQTILRLRYGLSDDDERAYGVGEIARMLDLPRKRIDTIIHGALLRLRALVNGTATIVEKEGCKRITGIYKGRYRPAVLSPEQEDCLQQACTRLSTQGKHISIRTLAQESGLSPFYTTAFLQIHASLRVAPPKLDDQARCARLEAAYIHLQEQGIAVTNERLAREAHMSKTIAAAFLREKRGLPYESRQTHGQKREERLEAAYTALTAQEICPTYERLAKAAHTSCNTVRVFLNNKKRGAAYANA